MEFLYSASPEVYDYDRGSNGTFRMAIENDVTGIFEVIRFKFFYHKSNACYVLLRRFLLHIAQNHACAHHEKASASNDLFKRLVTFLLFMHGKVFSPLEMKDQYD